MTRHHWQLSLSAAILVTAAAGATPAAAQPSPQPRLEISANVGAVAGTSTFTESKGIPSNGGETETITADHGVKTPLAFNAGGAVRLAGGLWVGVQYAMADMKTAASITAVVPHPLLFNAPRTVQGTIDDAVHNERNVHVDLMYALPVPAVDVKVLAGPTFFNLTEDFVSSVTVNETYPFDTATFASAATKRLSKSAVGFNAGVDLARALSSHLAVGALIRYSRADVTFNDSEIGTQTVKAGGVEATAGIRFRF